MRRELFQIRAEVLGHQTEVQGQGHHQLAGVQLQLLRGKVLQLGKNYRVEHIRLT
jgi:hypothetical protein